MQGQVVRITHDFAKAWALIQRHEVGITQLTPTPAEPRFLGDQLQHVRPQNHAARAGRPAILQAGKNATAQGLPHHDG